MEQRALRSSPSRGVRADPLIIFIGLFMVISTTVAGGMGQTFENINSLRTLLVGEGGGDLTRRRPPTSSCRSTSTASTRRSRRTTSCDGHRPNHPPPSPFPPPPSPPHTPPPSPLQHIPTPPTATPQIRARARRLGRRTMLSLTWRQKRGSGGSGLGAASCRRARVGAEPRARQRRAVEAAARGGTVPRAAAHDDEDLGFLEGEVLDVPSMWSYLNGVLRRSSARPRTAASPASTTRGLRRLSAVGRHRLIGAVRDRATSDQ